MKRILIYTALASTIIVANIVAALVILAFGEATLGIYPAAALHGWPWLIIGAIGVTSAVLTLKVFWFVTGA